MDRISRELLQKYNREYAGAEEEYSLEEHEYRLLKKKYLEVKGKAEMYRNKYTDKCIECLKYGAWGGVFVWFYYHAIVRILSHVYGPAAAVIGAILGVALLLYGIFFLHKVWRVYLEGTSPRARAIARKKRMTPLTLSAENYNMQALELENRLKEMERKRLDEKWIDKA